MAEQHTVHGVMEADQYDGLIRSIVPVQALLLSSIIDYLPTGSQKILELGCGTGILTEMILGRYPDVEITAIDLSPEMLAIASEKPGLGRARFLVQDLRDSWPQECYDAVVTSLCLHHVPREDRIAVAKRAAQALAPDGRFICGDIFRAKEDWEERLLVEAWCRGMRLAGTPDDVIRGMIAQRAKHLPTFTTVAEFRDIVARSGFNRAAIPFTSGFVGMVVGFSPGK
ncbi:MAG: class I SAM-dependent methyltransferase [Methanoregulaceae archaeon]